MINKTSFIINILVVGLFLAGNLCFAEETEKNFEGNKCLSLRNQDVNDILVKFNVRESNILRITESPIKGLCEIVFDNKGRIGVVYIGTDKKYLISGPIWETATMFNKTQELLRIIKDNKRVDTTKISLNNAIILGNDTAAKKVIIFTDPDCPFSGQLHKTIKNIAIKRKDIAFYIKFFPLSIHKDAYWKAKSIVCNKSLQMLEDNFYKKAISKTECKTEEIDNTIRLAQSIGVSVTPTLILHDGRVVEGALPEVDLINLIDRSK